MIRLKSVSQAESLRGLIPNKAIELMTLLAGDDSPNYPEGSCPSHCYDPDTHGYLVIIQEGDDIERDIPEAGERGLLTFLDDDGLSPFEYVASSVEGGEIIYEAVMAQDDSRTIAFVIPGFIPIDVRLRQLLEAEAQPNM